MYYSVRVMYDKRGFALLSTMARHESGKKDCDLRIICTSPCREVEYYFDTLAETMQFLEGLWLSVDSL